MTIEAKRKGRQPVSSSHSLTAKSREASADVLNDGAASNAFRKAKRRLKPRQTADAGFLYKPLYFFQQNFIGFNIRASVTGFVFYVNTDGQFTVNAVAVVLQLITGFDLAVAKVENELVFLV